MYSVKYRHAPSLSARGGHGYNRGPSERSSMRRLLLTLAGFAAISCATAPKPEVKPSASLAAGPVVPPGFEKQANEVLTEYDLTHDGKPDVWKYATKDAAGKETLLRKEKDLNGDGKVDTWEKYAPDGTLVRVVYDLDFDAKPDVTLLYERDQLVRKEMAFGFDGLPRAWNFYEKGKLVLDNLTRLGEQEFLAWQDRVWQAFSTPKTPTVFERATARDIDRQHRLTMMRATRKRREMNGSLLARSRGHGKQNDAAPQPHEAAGVIMVSQRGLRSLSPPSSRAIPDISRGRRAPGARHAGPAVSRDAEVASG
jgi:hypothetical protein